MLYKPHGHLTAERVIPALGVTDQQQLDLDAGMVVL
jgi:hypothetical protein